MGMGEIGTSPSIIERSRPRTDLRELRRNPFANHLANSRECRANSCKRDMPCRDPAGWRRLAPIGHLRLFACHLRKTEIHPAATFRDGTAGCIFPPLPCTEEEL
jgi:hypothetical protein